MDASEWATADDQIMECRAIALRLRQGAAELEEMADHWEGVIGQRPSTVSSESP